MTQRRTRFVQHLPKVQTDDFELRSPTLPHRVRQRVEQVVLYRVAGNDDVRLRGEVRRIEAPEG